MKNLIIRKNGLSEISFLTNAYESENDILRVIIKQMFNELVKINKSGSSLLFIIAKFRYSDGSIKSLHSGKVIDLDDKFIKRYLSYIKSVLDKKSNDYKLSEAQITDIIFNFFFVPEGNIDAYKKFTDLNVKITKKVELERFNVNEKVYMLPNNMEYSSWGHILIENKTTKVITTNFGDVNSTITIEKGSINSISYINRDGSILKFTDRIFKDNIFIREFSNGVTFYIKKGKIILKIKPINTEFIPKLEISQIKNSKIGTLDIETIVKDGVHKPYLFSFFDGQNSFSWFENNASKLFDHILNRKYRGYTIYAHNLSRFDIIFLFKDIATLSSKGYKINYVKKEDKVIAIKIYNTAKKVSITIKDSILLLPISLAKLSKQFNLEVGKLTEPVFIGEGHNEYKSTDLNHYTKEIERVDDFTIWKQKIEAYCVQDCVALHNVLTKFRDLIILKFKIDIVKYSTTPSLAFAIYRTHYIPEDTIPVTKGNVFNFIRESYTGGSTEMYKPNSIGKEVYCYDVNSLYPAVMSNNKFPTGKIFQFEGDPTILNDTYWIGDAKVSTKSDLYQPYLQIHHKTSNGYRTVAANGKFNMIIHSPEYENALKDYKISVSKGYLFESQSNIFKKYVDEMYDLRQQYSKADPMNLVAKLLLNSLYGRFGMQPQVHTHEFCNFEDFKTLSQLYEIEDHIEVDNDLFFVTYNSENFKDLDSALPRKKSSGVSISIASAVTSYARIYMSQFKNNPNYNLYYTDTDSIFVDKELNPIYVSTDLGKMKLEYKFTDSIFLAPKVYCGITSDNKKICKIKGYTNSSDLSLDDFNNLLFKDAVLTLEHTKWFRDLVDSNILMKNTPYNLVQTDNKRELIIDSTGKAIDTKAFKI